METENKVRLYLAIYWGTLAGIGLVVEVMESAPAERPLEGYE